MINLSQPVMSPLDIVVLLKIVSGANGSWLQADLAEELHLSQSEISKSLARSRHSGLLSSADKKVSKKALLEFLQYGIAYAFPAQPGALTRGIATAHSAPPLKDKISSEDNYVWPSAKGKIKGQAIVPLYKSVPQAVEKDPDLYELLALVDALRVGRVREKEIAIEELQKKILNRA